MIIDAIRLRNLQRIIDEDFKGKRGELARAVGKAETQIGRFFFAGKNHRNIGKSIAREIEVAAGKPEGWLDIEHIDTDILAQAIVGIDALLAKVQFEVKPPQRAKLIAIAYEESMRVGELQLNPLKGIIEMLVA